ncbi:cell envelope integrity protein CreD [Puteibacter caeruleilacunae]|nr:cell envelope integrity protein CreD [Puteibacter caeruleilacunae]
MENRQGFLESHGITFHQSVTFKLFTIGFLVLLLWIPSSMISSLVRERRGTQVAARNEVMSRWSEQQTVRGPFLSIPFKKERIDKETKEVSYEIQTAHFLPNELMISGDVEPHTLKRSIYKIIVYESKLMLSGHFDKPDFSQWNIKPENILWDKAQVSIGLSDPRGIQEQVKFTLDGKQQEFVPGLNEGLAGKKGIHLIQPIDPENFSGEFICDLSVKGSESLMFAPIGKTTTCELKSPWKSPSFVGAFTTTDRQIDESGFNAKWKILHFNRDFPQQWRGDDYSPRNNDFGVNLIVTADDYQKNIRSSKYAILIILLTFLTFFMSEVLDKNRIHPLQYIMVGLAVVIFYLLLLSLSEHAGFNLAYLLSCFAVVVLIFFYSKAFLSKVRTAFILAGLQCVVFGFIYVLLQMEDYALLMGSIGMFSILSVIMIFTRKMDWYKIGK